MLQVISFVKYKTKIVVRIELTKDAIKEVFGNLHSSLVFFKYKAIIIDLYIYIAFYSNSCFNRRHIFVIGKSFKRISSFAIGILKTFLFSSNSQALSSSR